MSSHQRRGRYVPVWQPDRAWGAGPAEVYRCFDADGSCLYVGATTDLPGRLIQHKQSTSWAWLTEKVESTPHASLQEARAVEASEIRRLRPRWNIHGRGPRVDWQLSDYVEVMLGKQARRGSTEARPEAFDNAIVRMAKEIRRRWPDVADVVLSDLDPHVSASVAA